MLYLALFYFNYGSKLRGILFLFTSVHRFDIEVIPS